MFVEDEENIKQKPKREQRYQREACPADMCSARSLHLVNLPSEVFS